MKLKQIHYCIGAVLCVAVAVVQAYAVNEAPAENGKSPILVQAVMCETIEGYEPKNAAAVFSINVGKVSCFTAFDGIATVTYTMHKWYRQDELVTNKRLTLKPPSWSTYSSIQLREADKGPWRVEIWNENNQLIKTLRFSVTD